LTNTQLLLEAISYGNESNVYWWQAFSSKKEARKILSKAAKEKPDDYQIALLIAEKEDFYEDSLTESENYKTILRKIRKELEETE